MSTTKLVGLAGRKKHGKNAVADWLFAEKGYTQLAFADPLKQLVREVFEVPSKYLWGGSDLRETELDLDGKYWITRHQTVDAMAPQLRLMFGKHCADPIPALHLLIDSLSGLPTMTPRLLLQAVGTDWGKALWPDVWVEQTFRTINQLAEGGFVYEERKGLVGTSHTKPVTKIVLTDVRFPKDEGRQLLQRGGLLLWVDASRRIHQDPNDPSIHHVSEKATLHDYEDEADKLKDVDCEVEALPNHGTLDDLHARLRKRFA